LEEALQKESCMRSVAWDYKLAGFFSL
jgi:hypothetical protein